MIKNKASITLKKIEEEEKDKEREREEKELKKKKILRKISLVFKSTKIAP